MPSKHFSHSPQSALASLAIMALLPVPTGGQTAERGASRNGSRGFGMLLVAAIGGLMTRMGAPGRVLPPLAIAAARRS